jgi:histidine ammonia-lyase
MHRFGTDPINVTRVVELSRNATGVSIPSDVVADLERAHLESLAASQTSVAYGRTTGVGANRNEAADDTDGGHGMRLIRSHAAGSGRAYPDVIARAGMVVRAHQLSQPGSGIRPDVVRSLVEALHAGGTAPFREFGGVGTGDITVLGQLATCLVGEQPWSDGVVQKFAEPFDASDALSFMSSSAPTLGLAAHALERLATVIRASWTIATLSSVPIRANRQQWSEVAQSTRPSAGVSECMTVIRRLLEGTDYATARTQDPLAYRVMPFIFGPLLESLGRAVDETNLTINSRIENPRFADGGVWHHGAFNLTSVALAFDTLRLAMCQWASSSVARIVKLNDPAYTDQGRFLAQGPAGSSGVMVLEYSAASALETVRTLADPSSRHTTSISVGTEDHAPFASRSVAATYDIFEAFETVVACELLTALRAVRGCETVTLGGPMVEVGEACAALSSDTDDRVLVNDVDQARNVLPALAELYSIRL